MSHRIVVAAVALTVAVPASAAGASALRLDLSATGEGTRATWKAHAGLPDPTSNKRGDHALVLEKRVATTPGAALAEVGGIAGTPVQAIAKLQWNRRSDTSCTAGAPRWSLSISGTAGMRYTVSLGCAGAAHTPGDFDGWTMDFWGAEAIQAQVQGQAGADALSGTLTRLAIVVDEGPASTVLDNLIVTTRTVEGRWYGPGS